MNKLDTLIAFVALSICTTILFQNCSSPKALDRSAIFNIEGQDADDVDYIVPDIDNEDNPTPMPTGPVTNRSLPLDNKATMGQVEFSDAVGYVFHYETNYIATASSTLVKIENNGTNKVLSVQSDQCMGTKNLTTQEITTFFGLFGDAYVSSIVKEPLPNETQEMNCGFPRLLMNAPGMGLDLEIFLSSRACAINGDLYLEDVNMDGGDDTIRVAIQTYFRGHINEVCGI